MQFCIVTTVFCIEVVWAAHCGNSDVLDNEPWVDIVLLQLARDPGDVPEFASVSTSHATNDIWSMHLVME